MNATHIEWLSVLSEKTQGSRLRGVSLSPAVQGVGSLMAVGIWLLNIPRTSNLFSSWMALDERDWECKAFPPHFHERLTTV